MRKIYLSVLLILFNYISIAQRNVIDKNKFELSYVIKNKNVSIEYWFVKTEFNQESYDSLKNRLIVRKTVGKKHKIIFNDRVRDGDFELIDINKDGIKDLVTTYHDYYVVHLLNKTKYVFEPEFQIPFIHKLLNKKKHLFYSYCEPEWGIRKPFSVLYSILLRIINLRIIL